jgi:methylthioxylose transferase
MIATSAVALSRRAPQANDLPDSPAASWRRGDGVALAVALVLIAIAALVGHEMNRRGLPIVLPRPPLLAFWHPHVGWGTPLAILSVLLGLWLQRVAAVLPWRRLLLAAWLLKDLRSFDLLVEL